MRVFAGVMLLVALVIAPGAAWADPKADFAACSRTRAAEPCRKAVQTLTAEIRKSPNDAELYEMRGAAYAHIRDFKRAIDDLNQAIKLKPSELTYLLRGSVRGMSHDLDGAIADANQALRLNPKSTDAYLNIAYAYMAKGDYNRVIAALTHAIALNPKQARLYTARAGAYGNKGDKASAEADCQRALALMPKRDGDMGYDGNGQTVRCHPELAK